MIQLHQTKQIHAQIVGIRSRQSVSRSKKLHIFHCGKCGINTEEIRNISNLIA